MTKTKPQTMISWRLGTALGTDKKKPTSLRDVGLVEAPGVESLTAASEIN
jgi:hypothetical protein